MADIFHITSSGTRPSRRCFRRDNRQLRTFSDTDLYLSQVDELASLYDALSGLVEIWTGCKNQPRTGGGDDNSPVLTICDEETDRAFEMMRQVARELRDREPDKYEADNRRRVLADWAWRTGGDESWA